jgi:Ca-activated chloride channel family protein
MSDDLGAARHRIRWPGEFGPRSHSENLPSWLFSVLIHGALLFLVASELKSCGPGSPGNVEGDFRTVGIYVKEAAPREETTPTEQTPETLNDSTLVDDVTRVTEIDAVPPVALTTPSVEPLQAIGLGAPPKPHFPPADNQFAQPSGILRPTHLTGEESGKTRFFGISDSGSRIVYVLDASGSMITENAIAVAKRRLIASLEHLGADQDFQIVFYNEQTHMMTVPGTRQTKMFSGTDINRTLARQYIGSVTADMGTRHLPALRMALKLEPDVLYFLTDADDPLQAPDLDRIRKMNRKETRIHCIEFGIGGEIALDNFLKKLARQNGGSYRYEDVTKFGRD